MTISAIVTLIGAVLVLFGAVRAIETTKNTIPTPIELERRRESTTVLFFGAVLVIVGIVATVNHWF